MPQRTVVPLLKKQAPTVVAPTLTGLDVKFAKPVPVGNTIETLLPEDPARPPDADVLNPTLYVVNAFAAEDGGVTATKRFVRLLTPVIMYVGDVTGVVSDVVDTTNVRAPAVDGFLTPFSATVTVVEAATVEPL